MREELIDRVVEDIIGYSDGSFNLHEPEEYAALTAEERQHVDDLVSQEISSCAVCGWYWHINNLEHSENLDGAVCHYCWDDVEGSEDEN